MLVARSPVGVSVAKRRASVLQTRGLGRASLTLAKNFNPFTATGYFDIPPPRWPTFLAMLFHILKEGMGLSLLDELEVQYHVIKK